MSLRIVTGGQTGVDRAALDVGLGRGLNVGGWCPAGRRAEDGPIPEHYPLTETDSEEYADRTRRNVEDAAVLLVLTEGPLAGGTALAVEVARRLGRPRLIVDLLSIPAATHVVNWLREHKASVVNVAGPRESSAPGIYERAAVFVGRVLDEWFDASQGIDRAIGA